MNGDARGGMEGNSSNTEVKHNYNEFDLDSSSRAEVAEGEEVNLEDEPVAKILLPSVTQKKPATIKINLQNPVFNKKNIPSIKLKPTEEVIDPKQVSVQSIPIPVTGDQVIIIIIIAFT